MSGDTPIKMKRPTSIHLSRVSDRITFLYLERARIVQDENGVAATVDTDEGRTTAYLPVAALTSLLLGPGTTLTHAAAATAGRAGCGISFVGAGGVRSYSTFPALNSHTELLVRQAEIVTNSTARQECARQMYVKRFKDRGIPSVLTVAQLRGLEGARVKAIYANEARKRRITHWRRVHGDTDPGPQGAVNQALDHANVALYGLVHAVVTALGLSPGLGVVHEGQRNAFVLDIADLYKAELTIPLSFKMWKSAAPGRDAMRELRDDFRLLRFIPRVVDDIYELLGMKEANGGGEWDVETLRLWAPEGAVAAGRNQFDA